MLGGGKRRQSANGNGTRTRAADFPVEADIVVAGGLTREIMRALGFAQELKNTVRACHLFRNHYIGRTFLQPEPAHPPTFDVRVKLNLIKEMVAGKRVVVVDDSIRGVARLRVRVL